MSIPDSPPPPSSRLSGVVRRLVYFTILLFILGAGAIFWTLQRTTGVGNSTGPALGTMESRPGVGAPASPSKAPLTLDAAEARMALLEARLAEAEERAAQARDDASRAERLLILVSVRRAVDQGMQLGYLEAMLQRGFGQTYPRDVGLITGAAKQPVTREQLTQELSSLAGGLKTAPGDEGMMGSLLSDLRGIAVVRRADAPSDAPAKRLERAEQALARDQVNLALREVAAMPGAPKARAWLDRGRRYVAVRAALDRLEAVTILNPQAAGLPAPPSR